MYDKIFEDLKRSHPFAYERVGFAFSKTSKINDDETIVFLYDYTPISDSNYEFDRYSGAKSIVLQLGLQCKEY